MSVARHSPRWSFLWAGHAFFVRPPITSARVTKVFVCPRRAGWNTALAERWDYLWGAGKSLLRAIWETYVNAGQELLSAFRSLPSQTASLWAIGKQTQKCLHDFLGLTFAVGQVDSPEIVHIVQAFHSRPYFIRRKLSNPRDSELRLFRSALQMYDGSGLQLGSEGPKLCPLGVMSTVCARWVSLSIETFTGSTIFRRPALRRSSI